MQTDPIADLLTRVRNAAKARHQKVDIPASRMKVSVVDLWKKEGFIRDYKLFKQEQKGILRLYLKYLDKGQSVIQGLERVSRPSRRVYAGAKDIPVIRNGLGISILSTPRGVVTDTTARENNIGGEIICKLW